MFVIWLTGLPSSGKTTIADELAKRIPNMVVLDSDNLSWLFQEDFGREKRIKHNRQVATVAKILADHDVPVCVSLVSPYEENRKDARQIIGNERFLEVYVKCSPVCERRDVKGMYRKAREGRITNFTGIDDPYEEPKMPDVVVDTDAYSLEECVEKVIFNISKWSKPFVIVMGNQRSGTSFLVRALNLCGVYLGPMEKIHSTEINPVSYNLRGTWEFKDLNKITRTAVPRSKIKQWSRTLSLLRRQLDYGNLPKDISAVPSLSDTQIDELKKIVAELMIHPSPASGMKMARRLFMGVKDYLPANTIIVGIFRHPLRVIDSMFRGRGVPREKQDELHPKFLDLWRVNNKALLEILDTRPGFLLNFDWPKERMLKEISTIVDKLGLVETDLTSWYTEELKHSDNLDTNRFPDNELKELYEHLLLRAEQNDKVVIPSYYQPKIELRGVIRDLEEQNALLSNEIYKLVSNRPPTNNKSMISNLIRHVSTSIRMTVT